jgi:hypothetical protein
LIIFFLVCALFTGVQWCPHQVSLDRRLVLPGHCGLLGLHELGVVDEPVLVLVVAGLNRIRGECYDFDHILIAAIYAEYF